MNSIIIEYEILPTCTSSTSSFASATINKTTADTTFTNVFTSDNTLAKTWSSTNNSVATVDSNGQVSIIGIGNTNITVTQATDGAHCAVSTNYQLIVTAPTFPISAAPNNNTSFGTVSVSNNILQLHLRQDIHMLHPLIQLLVVQQQWHKMEINSPLRQVLQVKFR